MKFTSIILLLLWSAGNLVAQFGRPPDQEEEVPDASHRETRASAVTPPAAKSAKSTSVTNVTLFAGKYVGDYTLIGGNASFAMIQMEFNAAGQMVDMFGSGGPYGFGRPAFAGSVTTSGAINFTTDFPGEHGVWTGNVMPGGGGAWGMLTLSYTTGLVVNGVWQTAKGICSIPTDGDALYLDPVDTATGAYYGNHTLLRQNCPAGLDFIIEYRSTLRATGPLGTGWGHNFETRVDEIDSGQTLILNWTQNRRNYFKPAGGGAYTSTERGARYDALVKNGDGTYTLTRADQSKMDFTAAGKLAQRRNKHGQAINLVYNGSGQLTTVTEAISGRFLSFIYNTSGRLIRVTDTASRRAEFTYTLNKDTLESWVVRQTLGGPPLAGDVYTYDASARIITAQDWDGVIFMRNTYDEAARVVTQDDGRAETPLATFAYDVVSVPGRRFTQVTDRTGKSLMYTFDSAYQLLEVTNGNAEKTIHTYDAGGNRLSTRDPLGRTSTFVYDARGNLTSTTDPMNAVTTFVYDARNNLTQIINPAQKATAFTYDAANNILTATNALNQTVTTTYGANSLASQRTSARNGVTTYAYTAGLPTGVTDPNNIIITMAYDAVGRLTSITDAASKTRSFTYDGVDNLLMARDPLNNIVTHTYDKRGRKLSESNALSQITSFSYDGNDNPVSATDPLGNKTWFFYDNEDRLARIVDARGGATAMTYDAAGRLVAMTDATGQTATLRHDAAGNRTFTVDALGNRARTTYDQRGLATAVEDAHARSTTLGFDNLRRLAHSTNALGEVLQMAYDDLDRLLSVTDPLNQVSSQSYDADGNRTSLTNARNATTGFVFDLGKRLTSITVPGNRTTSYGYNSRDLVSSITEPSGQQTSLTYDDAARLVQAVDPVGTITYGYDAASRLLTVVQGGATLTRVYDAAGRLTQFTDVAGNVLKYAYDSAGNLTVLTYPDNKTVAYAYDAANRMIRVTDWASRVTSYTYDAGGRLATTTRPDGSVETRTWLPTGELASLDDRKGATILVQYNYSYDLAGRIVAENPQPARAVYAPASFAATYDSGNRLATFNGSAVTFDADGNMTNGPLATSAGFGAFVYDARNRLTSFGGVSYAYDAEDRRVSWTDGTGTTTCVINPNAPLSQLLVRTAPGGVVTRAVHGLGLLYEESGSVLRVYHYDYRGSAVAFTNAVGSVTGRVEYGPYGEVASRLNDTATPFLFSGKHGVATDPNGLCHMRARLYHAGVRMFVNQDVVLGTIVDGASINRFAYANGDPVSLHDPRGAAAKSVSESDDLGTGYEIRVAIHEWIPNLAFDTNAQLIQEQAQKNGIDVELIKAIIINEYSTTKPLDTSISYLYARYRDLLIALDLSDKRATETYGPAQLGWKAREIVGLSEDMVLTYAGAITGAARFLAYEKKRLIKEGVVNPTNAQIASRYNQGGIGAGRINKYGKRIQFLLNKMRH